MSDPTLALTPEDMTPRQLREEHARLHAWIARNAATPDEVDSALRRLHAVVRRILDEGS